MSEHDIQVHLGEIVHEVINRIPADEVTPEKNFVNDLAVDSLSMIEIALIAQERFDMDIPDTDMQDFKTVQDVIGYVHGAKVAS
jgi:acyl carrier protein